MADSWKKFSLLFAKARHKLFRAQLALFGVCHSCGACLEVRDGFCPGCRKKLSVLAQPTRLTASSLNFPIYYVHLWNHSSEHLLRSYVYYYKNLYRDRWMDVLAQQIVAYRQQLAHRLIRPILVPAPHSHKTPAKNHALQWAQSLERALPCDVADILEPLQKRRQKSRNWRQRQDIQFMAKRKISSQRTVVFVDDILTTGATARAVHKALGAPKNFEVWVKVFRAKR